MNTARYDHAATLLNDLTVVIAGGCGTVNRVAALASAELDNPATGTFATTGSLSTSRGAHTATLLNNGTVLIAGGFPPNGGVIAEAEFYDPTTGTFTQAGSMNAGRCNHTATLRPMAWCWWRGEQQQYPSGKRRGTLMPLRPKVPGPRDGAGIMYLPQLSGAF